MSTAICSQFVKSVSNVIAKIVGDSLLPLSRTPEITSDDNSSLLNRERRTTTLLICLNRNLPQFPIHLLIIISVKLSNLNVLLCDLSASCYKITASSILDI